MFVFGCTGGRCRCAQRLPLFDGTDVRPHPEHSLGRDGWGESEMRRLCFFLLIFLPVFPSAKGASPKVSTFPWFSLARCRGLPHARFLRCNSTLIGNRRTNKPRLFALGSMLCSRLVGDSRITVVSPSLLSKGCSNMYSWFPPSSPRFLSCW